MVAYVEHGDDCSDTLQWVAYPRYAQRDNNKRLPELGVVVCIECEKLHDFGVVRTGAVEAVLARLAEEKSDGRSVSQL